MVLTNNKTKSGFTLIELLVVIAIIGILSTLAIVALGNARAKARDTKRITDLKQISTALELYYADQGAYPTIITPGGSIVSPDGNTTYMTFIPHNPEPNNDGTCPANSDYHYAGNAKYYNLNSCLGDKTNNLGPGIIFGQNGSTLGCGSVMVTDIDGNTYQTVSIGTQCWLKENLNTGTMVSDIYTQNDADNGIFEKYCMDNDESNCSIYGGLYQWHTAVALRRDCDFTKNCTGISKPYQGICPPGWSIPTGLGSSGGVEESNDDSGWEYLGNYLAIDGNGGSGESRGDIGGKLKESGVVHWLRDVCDDGTPPTAICNSTGFTAIGAGTNVNQQFIDFQYKAYWWSTTEETDNYSYGQLINSDDSSLSSPEIIKKEYGLSIRCVMGSTFKPR